MNFKSYVHRRIFNAAFRTRKNTDKEYLAVLFLLTSNRTMWNRIKNYVQCKSICFDEFPMSGCSEEEYTLFLCATDIYFDSRNVTVSELADSALISKEVFNVIVGALEIARYGMGASGRTTQTDSSETSCQANN